MHGFNAVRKRYLANFLRICSTPKVDKIESKRVCVDDMTDKEEVSFAKECKHLMDLCDEIGTKGDKKHVKHRSKERLKQKY